jgi:DNA-binding transcriptional MerR regulator
LGHHPKDGIRHYEQLGLIKSAPRKAGGKIYRDYDASTPKRIDLIRGAQHTLGLSLKEIRPLLKSIEKNPPTTERVIEYLVQRRSVIRRRIKELQEIADFLDLKISRYRAGDFSAIAPPRRWRRASTDDE